MAAYEIGTEKGYCSSIQVTSGTTTAGFGTSLTNPVNEFNGDIEFSDVTGTDMIKRNPWDSQW